MKVKIKREYQELLPWIAGGVLVILSVIGMYLVLSGKTRQTPQDSGGIVTEEQTTSTETLVPRALDGVLDAQSEQYRAPWAVVIDNHGDARPPSGLSQASVVYELPVEGGITRYLALFAPSSTLSWIGPVRSARPYAVEFAASWKALFAHVGGSPDGLELVRALDGKGSLWNADEMGWAGSYFWRNLKKIAPHQVYVRGEKLAALDERLEHTSTTISAPWHFLPDVNASSTSGGVTGILVPYGGSYTVRWTYDADTHSYARSLGGAAHKDENGTRLKAENIIVMKTEMKVLDEKGRLELRTLGSGDAIAYRDGERFALRWRRSKGEGVRFESESGTEFLLRPGVTWVEVVTTDSQFGGIPE